MCLILTLIYHAIGAMNVSTHVTGALDRSMQVSRLDSGEALRLESSSPQLKPNLNESNN